MSIIAISRGTFSGGEALAKRVADRLGYQCLSREVNLEEAAKQSGVPVEELGIAMERRPSFWERMVGERSAYLVFVQAAFCEQARWGRLVYHGHVGQLLLPGVSHVIGVRVIADVDGRLKAVMRQRGLTRQDALAYIEKVDKERRDWTRFLFGVEWDAPQLYDLVLNLSRMSLDTACETVARLTERAEFQPTAASVKAMQDLTLHSRVSAALATDFRTRDADLRVTADDGIVTITGTTPWPEVADAVPSVVRQVDGVKEVRSEIAGVTPPTPLTWY
ncbi:MAG TPA: cytidylate kinase family protein [Acidimicrobiales bacterium]|nr:cytidylate kinase family protein [Acidimicrobiales bacterium]